MPIHSEKKILPHSARQMFDLIADIAAYPQFLPWCAAARVRGVSVLADGSGEIIDAELVISFKLFREKFGSRVTLHPKDGKIGVEYLDGPFRYLNNHWVFREVTPTSCEIDFFVDFEFRSAILQTLIGLVFTEAMYRIVRAFEARAKVLYAQE